MYRSPKILVLHIDRFRVEADQSAQTLEPVDFKEHLDIAEFSAATHPDETEFILYGLILHSGLASQSNFEAWYRDFGTEAAWYRYSGQGRVERVLHLEKAAQKRAVMLFYIRMDVARKLGLSRL